MSGKIQKYLIAARALIDTPEKFHRVGAAAEAIRRATEPGTDRQLCLDQLSSAYDRKNPTNWGDWDSVLTRFDRAIAALERSL